MQTKLVVEVYILAIVLEHSACDLGSCLDLNLINSGNLIGHGADTRDQTRVESPRSGTK